jgi:hypothetical protein
MNRIMQIYGLINIKGEVAKEVLCSKCAEPLRNRPKPLAPLHPSTTGKSKRSSAAFSASSESKGVNKSKSVAGSLAACPSKSV